MHFRLPQFFRSNKKQTRQSRHHKTRKLFHQPLEARELMAADVSLDLAGMLSIRDPNPAADESLNVIVDQSGQDIVVRAEASLTNPAWQEVGRFAVADVKRMTYVGTNNDDFFVNNTSLLTVAYGHGGNDQMYGGFCTDTFDGGAGTDILDGRWGNDTYAFIGENLGFDTINDRTGQNTLDFQWYTQSRNMADGLVGVAIDLRRTDIQTVSPTGGLQLKLAPGAAQNVVGTRFNDTIRGNEAANRLVGGDGDDTLEAEGGVNDVLFGENGNDTLVAGYLSRLYGGNNDDGYVFRGSDALSVVTVTDHHGIDTLLLNEFGYGVEVDLARTVVAVESWPAVQTPGGLVSRLVVNLAIANPIEHVIGSEFGDTIRGNGLDNWLFGLGGSDFIEGRGGDDLLVGGRHDDTYVFDNKSLGGSSLGFDIIGELAVKPPMIWVPDPGESLQDYTQSGEDTLDFRGMNERANVNLGSTSRPYVNSTIWTIINCGTLGRTCGRSSI